MHCYVANLHHRLWKCHAAFHKSIDQKRSEATCADNAHLFASLKGFAREPIPAVGKQLRMDCTTAKWAGA